MTTWREQWTDLGDEFRCVALDHRAHGRSEIPSTGDVTLAVDGPGPGDGAGCRGAGAAGRAHRPFDGGDGDPRARRATTGPLRRADRRGGAPRCVGLEPAARRDGGRDRPPAAAARFPHRDRPPRGSPPQGDPRGPRRRPRDRRSRDAVRSGGSGRRREPCAAPGRAHVIPRMDRRPLGVDGDGLPTCAAADHRPRAGRRRRSRPRHAARCCRRACGCTPGGRLFIVEGAGHIAMLERPERLNPELRTFAREAMGLGKASGKRRKGAA